MTGITCITCVVDIPSPLCHHLSFPFSTHHALPSLSWHSVLQMLVARCKGSLAWLEYAGTPREREHSGNIIAQLKIAWKYYRDNNIEKARVWFKIAAEQGDAEAQYDYGAFLDNIGEYLVQVRKIQDDLYSLNPNCASAKRLFPLNPLTLSYICVCMRESAWVHLRLHVCIGMSACVNLPAWARLRLHGCACLHVCI